MCVGGYLLIMIFIVFEQKFCIVNNGNNIVNGTRKSVYNAVGRDMCGKCWGHHTNMALYKRTPEVRAHLPEKQGIHCIHIFMQGNSSAWRISPSSE